MKKLLKQYNFQSDMQYFEMIAISFHNGQRLQAERQFKALPKKERVQFLKSACCGAWKSGIPQHNLEALFDSLLT